MDDSVYVARLASDTLSRRDVYRLRYECYRAGNFIDERADRMFRDEYDDLPNTRTVIVYRGGRPVASVRTSVFSSADARASPGRTSFPDVILSRLPEGEPGLEATRMVRSPDCDADQGLVLLLYRLAGFIGIAEEAAAFFAAVRANHVPFYRRFGYSVVAEARPYPGLLCPMQLLQCTRERFAALCAAYPAIDPFTEASDDLWRLLDGDEVRMTVVGRAAAREDGTPARPGRRVWKPGDAGVPA